MSKQAGSLIVRMSHYPFDIYTIYEKAEDPIHSDMAHPICGLAMLAQMRGRYVEAEPLYQRALTILEQTQGPMYPDLIAILRAYAKLLYQMGRREKARVLEACAEAIERKIREESDGDGG